LTSALSRTELLELVLAEIEAAESARQSWLAGPVPVLAPLAGGPAARTEIDGYAVRAATGCPRALAGAAREPFSPSPRTAARSVGRAALAEMLSAGLAISPHEAYRRARARAREAARPRFPWDWLFSRDLRWGASPEERLVVAADAVRFVAAAARSWPGDLTRADVGRKLTFDPRSPVPVRLIARPDLAAEGGRGRSLVFIRPGLAREEAWAAIGFEAVVARLAGLEFDDLYLIQPDLSRWDRRLLDGQLVGRGVRGLGRTLLARFAAGSGFPDRAETRTGLRCRYCPSLLICTAGSSWLAGSGLGVPNT
jgi:hypothetical protein